MNKRRKIIGRDNCCQILKQQQQPPWRTQQPQKLFLFLSLLLLLLLLLQLANATAPADNEVWNNNETIITQQYHNEGENEYYDGEIFPDDINDDFFTMNNNTNNNVTMTTICQESLSSSTSYFQQPQHALVYPWVVQLFGVIIMFILHHYEIPIPFAAVMFIIGMIMGIITFRYPTNTQFYNSIRIWSDIDSQVLLLIFLPGLIFRDAIDIDIWIFQKCFYQLLILAFPMVLVGTVLTAIVVVYILPSASNTSVHDQFTWPLGLTMGAILASTDPVAVAAVLKSADAPTRLQMHIGGESMLNDGAAVVFYSIFATQFLAELGLNDTTITVGQGFLTFVRMSLGGVAVGLGFAMGLLLLLYELDRRLDKENNVLQVVAAVSTAYMSYYVSEQVCQMSGVIACVTCGVMTKALGGSRLLADPELMDTYLKLLEHLLNTLLFTLGGTVFGEVIANSDQRAHFTATEWLSLLILYAFVMLIRGVQVTLFYPLLANIGMSTNRKEMALFSFAGLRGAVGIALALALDRTVRQSTTDEDSRAMTSTVVGLAGGVSFLTLLINGTLTGWLLQKLELTPPKASRKQVLKLFEISARDFILHAYQKLKKKQPRFEHVPFAMIQDHLPFLTSVDQDYVESMDDQNPHSTFYKKVIHRRSNSNALALEEMEEAARQTMRAVHPTTPGGSAVAAVTLDPVSPEKMIMEVREIFLKMLDAAYHAEVSLHGGFREDDNGFTYETLHQSVVFAAKNCRLGEEPLHDWDVANSFALHLGPEQYARRIGRWIKTKLFKADPKDNYAYQKKRSRVVRALVFMEAHRRAEQELMDYLKGHDLSLSSGMAVAEWEAAILTVLDESKAQVQQAEEWLATGVSSDDLFVIRSHYMASILLHKLGLYVEKSVRGGRLKESEGRLFLSQIDSRIHKVSCCQSKHTEETHRRKRQKQKSTGSTISSSLDSFWNGARGGAAREGRVRRKKQISAPAESSFWTGQAPADSTPSTTVANTGTANNVEGVGAVGDAAGAGRRRRMKQCSAPAEGSFWTGETTEDSKCEGEKIDDPKGSPDDASDCKPSLHRQWSTCSNASAPDHSQRSL